jgi:Fic family protein
MKPPVPAPSTEEIIDSLRKRGGNALLDVLSKGSVGDIGIAPRGKYYHWDNLRHLNPPDDLAPEDWWLLIRMARRTAAKSLPLANSEGRAFQYCLPDEAQELLHYIDQHSAGEIRMQEVVVGSDDARRHYLVNSLIAEAIRSSQLEGATTTFAVAKDMIRSGRPPKDRSERMILNNFRAMEFMLEDVAQQLTPDRVVELQRILTDGTLENPTAAGRLQQPDEERVVVGDITDGSILHRPPPADQLPRRLEAMCRFANGETPNGFLHPVVRAVLLHFWLAYDHPFEDGNGRTARALFYWCMQRQGYWLTEYLSISNILRHAPSKYYRSFLLTETDYGDTTYFILYHLGVIRRAIEQLHQYLERKMAEIRELEAILRGSDEFNYRQLALLSNALREPRQRYTLRGHALSHRVTHETARHDLLELRRRGLLQMSRSGRHYVFAPIADLGKELANRGRRR